MSYKCNACGAVTFHNSGLCSVCCTFGSLRLYKGEFEDFIEDKHDGVHYDPSNPKYRKRCN